jgi:hypothetical protein
MTARDDYPKLAEIAAYDMAEYGESPRFGAALDEIDRLRKAAGDVLDEAINGGEDGVDRMADRLLDLERALRFDEIRGAEG